VGNNGSVPLKLGHITQSQTMPDYNTRLVHQVQSHQLNVSYALTMEMKEQQFFKMLVLYKNLHTSEVD
jgi:hypothetical protein